MEGGSVWLWMASSLVGEMLLVGFHNVLCTVWAIVILIYANDIDFELCSMLHKIADNTEIRHAVVRDNERRGGSNTESWFKEFR